MPLMLILPSRQHPRFVSGGIPPPTSSTWRPVHVKLHDLHPLHHHHSLRSCAASALPRKPCECSVVCDVHQLNPLIPCIHAPMHPCTHASYTHALHHSCIHARRLQYIRNPSTCLTIHLSNKQVPSPIAFGSLAGWEHTTDVSVTPFPIIAYYLLRTHPPLLPTAAGFPL